MKMDDNDAITIVDGHVKFMLLIDSDSEMSKVTQEAFSRVLSLAKKQYLSDTIKEMEDITRGVSNNG